MATGTTAVSKVLTKIFGSRNDRLLKRYRRIVEQINELGAEDPADDRRAARARTARSCAAGSSAKETSARTT